MNELFQILAPVANAILLIALPALVVAVIAALGVWVKKELAVILRDKPDLARELAYYARIAVEAAEQAGAAKLVKSKREYAVAVVQEWLNAAGLGAIDVRLIEAEIERQVYAMKQDEALRFVLPDGE